jgi:hypothetical protein
MGNLALNLCGVRLGECMAGLTDMEELLAKVADKEVAEYLREALACYGTGAYRGCIVLTHTALFEDLRRKVRQLAPVNSTAKTVSEAIEPIAAAQKPFETPLIQQMKSAGIITELEAKLLEQLNSHRNKAAHPSGHKASAEEARYVFAESITKFLSQPIRETTYVIEDLSQRLRQANFFPTMKVADMKLIVDEELSRLDPMAMPFLLKMLGDGVIDEDEITSSNARAFLLGLARRRTGHTTTLIGKHVLSKLATHDTLSKFVAELISSDSKIILDLDPASKLRVRSLLLKNAKDHPTPHSYLTLRHPARNVTQLLEAMGEKPLLEDFGALVDWVVENCPYDAEFLFSIRGTTTILKRVKDEYQSNAASADFATANRFAAAFPAIDQMLAKLVSGKEAFALFAGVVGAASVGARQSRQLKNDGFVSTQKTGSKARLYSVEHSDDAEATLLSFGIEMTLEDFRSAFLTPPADVISVESEAAGELD